MTTGSDRVCFAAFTACMLHGVRMTLHAFISIRITNLKLSSFMNRSRISVYLLMSSLMLIGCYNKTEPARQSVSETPVPIAEPLPESPRLSVSELRSKLGANQNARFRKSSGVFIQADLTRSGVKDITALKGLPLKYLSLAECPITDLSPLAGMPLESLNLMQCPVKDISVLNGMPLKQLSLMQTQVEDIAVIENMPLEILDLTACPITDLTPLKGMPLQQLYLEGTKITDLAPLSDMQLKVLRMEHTPVTDIAPLAGLPLEQLNLFDTQVRDISAVKDMPLDTLWLTESKVENLAALPDKSLRSLDIEGTTISDIRVLAEMKSLQRLNIANTPIVDLSPLKNLQLQRLIFSPERIKKGMEHVRLMSSLREMGTSFETRRPPEQFWSEFDKPSDKSSE